MTETTSRPEPTVADLAELATELLRLSAIQADRGALTEQEQARRAWHLEAAARLAPACLDAPFLCVSDAGDGGWSLHDPQATEEEIADGSAEALATGYLDQSAELRAPLTGAERAEFARLHPEVDELLRAFGPARD